MNDVKHWLDEASDADDFERSVLRVGRLSADPPPGAEDAVWATVLGAVAVAPIAAVAMTSSAQAAVSGAGKALGVWLGVGKGFIVGLAIYGAAVGGSELATHFTAQKEAPTSSAPKPARRPLVPLAAAPLAPAVVTTLPESALDSAPPAPSTSSLNGARSITASSSAQPAVAQKNAALAFPDLESEPRVGQLQAEASALRQARAELRAGKLADAFATLEASRRQFSAAELYQERESLMIELLFRSGQVATAKERAAAFLQRFPDSPHAETIRQFAERTSSR